MPSINEQDDIDLISSPLVLPNGTTVPNRLVKVAMEEGIGFGGGLPTKRHERLYKRWAEGGWGMIVTGNVHVDPQHLATPHCRSILDDTSQTVSAYASLRQSISSSSSLPTPICLVQLSHGGLQSSSTINMSRAPWVQAVAPCEARPNTGSSIWGWLLSRVIWPRKSRRLRYFDDWLEIVDMFIRGARIMHEAGWDGVQVHTAHGYLLAEYLSPLTNPDPIPLPGVPYQIPLRLHLLWLILTGIHAATDHKFIKAIKINSSDFVQGGLDEVQAAQVIKEIVSWELVDILEISGGSYSNPAFASLDALHAPTRQSLFSHFTTSLIPHLAPPPKGPAILLTGGLHDRTLIASSLRDHACHLVGIGRPACVKPCLPHEIILNRDIPDCDSAIGGYTIPGGEAWKRFLGGGRSSSASPVSTYTEVETESSPLVAKHTQPAGVPLVGAGISTFWHEWQLSRISRGKEPWMDMGWGVGAVWEGVVWGVFKGFGVALWRDWRERV
ncbi:hypothetical protein BCR39DRAFT_554447, partial [Naematelia encephala]